MIDCILLGCTELSIALPKSRLRRKVIESESEFAEIIANRIQTISITSRI